MINTRMLKAKMVENNLTIKTLSQEIGISEVSLNYKLNNKREFKSNEIKNIGIILNLTCTELCNIFFNSL